MNTTLLFIRSQQHWVYCWWSLYLLICFRRGSYLCVTRSLHTHTFLSPCSSLTLLQSTAVKFSAELWGFPSRGMGHRSSSELSHNKFREVLSALPESTTLNVRPSSHPGTCHVRGNGDRCSTKWWYADWGRQVPWCRLPWQLQALSLPMLWPQARWRYRGCVPWPRLSRRL